MNKLRNIKLLGNFYYSHRKPPLKPSYIYYFRIQQSHNQGSQNVFYFEESNITKKMDKADPNYIKLYEKIPLIAILGWTGSTDKVLKKYHKIYADIGYHTIRFSPSDYTVFLERRKHKSYTEKFINILQENKLNRNQYLVHTFSNASNFVIYHHLVENKDNGYDFFTKNQRGLIFDSGPGFPSSPIEFFKGLNGLVEEHVSIAPLKYLISATITLSFLTFHIINFGNHYFTHSYNVILRDDRDVPLLVLYSTIDSLVDFRNIAKYAEDKKKLFPNLHVKTVVYNDADHVSLYAKHPKDYIKQITNHLATCKLNLNSILDDSEIKLLKT